MNTQPQTQAQALEVPNEWILNTIQRTALNLHKRGLNVLPVIRGTKQPYLLRPFYFQRLTPGYTFKKIFSDAKNLAIMTGHTSGNLIAIDCDTPHAFSAIGTELTSRNLTAWAYTSARGGSYLFRLAEGEAANTKSSWENVEIYGRQQYVVVPPSVHPTGVIYQWITDPLNLPTNEGPPIVSIHSLEWLGVKLWQRTRPAINANLPTWASALSHRNRKILANALEGQYHEGERNTAITPLVYDAAALIMAGLANEDDVLNTLHRIAKALSYPMSHITQMLDSAKNKPGLERSSTAHAKQTRISSIETFTTLYDWNQHKRTKHTDRAIFIACIIRAKHDTGRNGWRASVREIAELAGISKQTAQSGLRRLQRAELIRYVGTDPSGANRYDWGNTVITHITNTEKHKETPRGGGVRSWYTISPCSCSVLTTHPQKTILPSTSAQQDVFTGRPATWRIWRHLLQQPERTFASMARATGVSRSTASRATKWLLARGLVSYSQAEALYIGEPVSDEHLERVAAAMGTLGRSEARKRKHIEERGRRLNYLVLNAIRRFEDRV